MDQVQTRLQQHWKWIGVGIGVIFVILALRGTDLRAVGRMLVKVSIAWLVLALAANLIASLLTALRWQVLLQSRNPPSIARLLGVLFIAQLLNGVLPGRVGFAARAYLVGSAGPGVAFTLGSMVIEKALEWLTLLLAAVILLLLVPVSEQVQRSMFVVGVTLVAFLVVAGFAGRYRDVVIGWSLRVTASRAILRQIQDGFDSLSTLMDHPVALQATFWSFVIWTLTVLSYGLVLKALGLRVPLFLTSLSLFVVLQIGMRTPTTPGGIGVFHYLAVFILGRFGVPREPALSYGILLHGIIFVVPGLLGALYILSSRMRIWLLLPEVRQATAGGEIHPAAVQEP